MSVEKDALASLDAIRKTLVDEEKLIPLSPYDFFINGIVCAMLFYFIPEIFMQSGISFSRRMIDAALWLLLPIILITIVGKWLENRENEKMERIFSKNQNFYRQFGIFIYSAACILTMLLSSIGGWFAIPVLWFIIIGAQLMVIGYFTKRIVLQVGKLFLIAGTSLGVLYFYLFIQSAGANTHIDPIFHIKLSNDLFTIGQYTAMILLPAGLFAIGISLLRKA